MTVAQYLKRDLFASPALGSLLCRGAVRCKRYGDK
jgi:hypothetical protein